MTALISFAFNSSQLTHCKLVQGAYLKGACEALSLSKGTLSSCKVNRQLSLLLQSSSTITSSTMISESVEPGKVLV